MPRRVTRSALRLSRRVALGGAASIGVAVSMGRVGRAAAQEATPTSVEESTEVVYGTVNCEELLMDTAQPSGLVGPRPAVILVHGGGLITPGPGRSELRNAAMALAEAGYVTFNIDYRLFSNADGTNPWPAQLDDAQ